MQMPGGFCDHRPDAGPGGADRRRKLYRRIFRTGVQGNDEKRGIPDPVDTPGIGGDGADLQLRQCRLHQDRDQYGCGPTLRGDRKGHSRGHQGTGFPGLREAGDILQRAGRQSVYGRGVSGRDGGGCGHQRGSQRAGRREEGIGKGAGQRVRGTLRDHQEDRIQGDPGRPACGRRSIEADGNPLRNRGSVPGAHSGHRGQRGGDPGRDRPGAGRRAGDYGGPGHAQ